MAAVIAVAALVVRPVRVVMVRHNTLRHVVFVMAQALVIFVAAMAGLLHWVWERTTIAHLAETTMGSVRLVMAAEHGKNK